MNINRLPDMLSFSRIILSFLFAYILFETFANNRYMLLSLLLFAVIISTDFLDGFLARKTGNTTDHGALLDVSADMIFVLLSYLALTLCGLVNVLFVLVLIVKFVEFLLTSRISMEKGADKLLYFDGLGMNVSKFWIAFPGIIILLSMAGFSNLKLVADVVCLITGILALLSTINRLISFR